MRSGVARVYDEARRDGLESARAEVAATIAEYENRCQRLDAILASLDAAGTDLAARDAVTLRDVESQTRTLAVGLAEAIVGHEVADAADPVGDSVRRSAVLLPGPRSGARAGAPARPGDGANCRARLVRRGPLGRDRRRRDDRPRRVRAGRRAAAHRRPDQLRARADARPALALTTSLRIGPSKDCWLREHQRRNVNNGCTRVSILPISDGVTNALHLAINGLDARGKAISSNVANLETPGYHAARGRLRDQPAGRSRPRRRRRRPARDQHVDSPRHVPTATTSTSTSS